MAIKAGTIHLADMFPASLSNRLAANLRPGPGLSFSHSGLGHDEVMARLEVTEDRPFDCAQDRRGADAAHRPMRSVTLRDPQNGLCVTLEYIFYEEHTAVLYGAVIKNEGKKNIERVTALRSFDLTISPLQAVGDPLLHTLGGGLTHYHYPPQAYRLQEWHLLGPTSVTIDSGPSGRSCNKDLPFFFIEDGDRSGGLYAGIEWSGMWHVTFTRSDEPQPSHYGRLGSDKSLAIRGGMDGVDLLLKTGESFHLPRFLVGFYEGPLHVGRNHLRRFISQWGPKLSGVVPLLIQGCPDGCYSKYQVDEPLCRANASAMAEVGAEYFMLANWLRDKESREKTYSATSADRGSWIPDPLRWPGDSLQRISEHVRALGMRMALWTDIEVASPESLVANEHPEWVLYLGGKADGEAADGLLNLALPAAQEWAIATYERLIRDYGVTWFYLDNNIDPRPFWDKFEPEHDRGRLQHDHIRGIWRVWSWILEHHPDVGLENCSSGGRRNDLGMLGRTHRSQSSDQFRHPDSIRYQSSGFNTVIPGDRVSTYTCCGLSPYPDVGFHANFGGMLALSEDFEHWPPEELARAKKHVQVYRSIRHLLGKDFYPLFPQPQSLGEWDGWQYHDPEQDEGFVLLFRARSQQDKASPRLQALASEQRYLFIDPYSGAEQVLAGAELLNQGLPVDLPVDGTRLLRYKAC